MKHCRLRLYVAISFLYIIEIALVLWRQRNSLSLNPAGMERNFIPHLPTAATSFFYKRIPLGIAFQTLYP